MDSRCSYCGEVGTGLREGGVCRDCAQARERMIDFMQALANRLSCMVLACSTRRRFDVTVSGRIVQRLPARNNLYCGLHARRIARLLRKDRLQQAA